MIKGVESETTVAQQEQQPLNHIQAFHMIIQVEFSHVVRSSIAIDVGHIRFKQTDVFDQFQFRASFACWA